MRRNRRKRTNFYNQNIKRKMNKQQFTITLTDYGIGKELNVTNNGFTPFELIGLLTHLLEKEKNGLQENTFPTGEKLEKEMD